MFPNFNFSQNTSYYPLRQNYALFSSKFGLSNDIDFYLLSSIPDLQAMQLSFQNQRNTRK